MALAAEVLDWESYSGPDGTGWICDRCGKAIEKAGDGWLQWIERASPTGERQMCDLTLVHHLLASPRKETHSHGCQFDDDAEFRKDRGLTSDLQLSEFCGADGLMHLLSLLEEPGSSRPDVLEMIKRIHIPGYERARRHMEAAIAERVIEPNHPLGYYPQSDIQAVLKWAEERDEDGNQD